jgi:hypothetical protein
MMLPAIEAVTNAYAIGAVVRDETNVTAQATSGRSICMRLLRHRTINLFEDYLLRLPPLRAEPTVRNGWEADLACG